MKTMTRVVAVALVAVVMCMMLASCGNTLSGSYTATYESNGIFGLGKGTYTTTYEFKGNKVVRTDDVTVGGSTTTTVTNGTYEIKDDQIIFTWDRTLRPTRTVTALFPPTSTSSARATISSTSATRSTPRTNCSSIKKAVASATAFFLAIFQGARYNVGKSTFTRRLIWKSMRIQ